MLSAVVMDGGEKVGPSIDRQGIGITKRTKNDQREWGRKWEGITRIDQSEPLRAEETSQKIHGNRILKGEHL